MSYSSSKPQELANGKLLLDYPSDQVARIAIHNPAKRNALDHDILDGIAQQIEKLDVRCLVLTGSEGMFSSGYDIGDIPDDVFSVEAEKLVAHPFASAVQALDTAPFATIAALTGHTIGGGLELALSCDLRVAEEGIKLGMPPAKLGLVYSHTGLRKFIDAIGSARTKELFLTGYNISADRALQWGLVNEVVSENKLSDTALKLADDLAGNAPLSISGNKFVIRKLLENDVQPGTDLERELIAIRKACFDSEDFYEGVHAFAEKRKANFKGK